MEIKIIKARGRRKISEHPKSTSFMALARLRKAEKNGKRAKVSLYPAGGYKLWSINDRGNLGPKVKGSGQWAVVIVTADNQERRDCRGR